MVNALNSMENSSPGQVAGQSVLLALIPAGIMFIGSLLTIMLPRPPPKVMAHALQHLAAGIVFCAIATELVPPLAAAKKAASIGGLVVGFVLGVGVMLGLSIFLEPPEEDAEEVSTELSQDVNTNGTLPREAETIKIQNTHDARPSLDGNLAGRMSQDGIAHHGRHVRSLVGQAYEHFEQSSGMPNQQEGELKQEGDSRSPHEIPSGPTSTNPDNFDGKSSAVPSSQIQAETSSTYLNPDGTSRGDARKYTAENNLQTLRPFPYLFAMCVYVDSIMDGLLIGISLITGNSAGVFMAIALCVEMGFLGLTFATTCAGHPRLKAGIAVVLGPLFLLFGACIGGLVAHALSANEPALVACTAFGVAALLYMVCEELLVAAHEEGDDHVWWVDIQVYVGFLLALLLEKAMGQY